MKSLKTVFALAAAFSTLLFTAPTQAATATTTFAVSATVASGCTVAALPLAFGAYDPTNVSPTDGSTSITVICTVGTSYNVGLNAGTGAGATVSSHKMTSGSNLMNYTLYRDSSRSQVWGNTIGTDTVSGTYAIGQAALNVYGRIPALQLTPAGTYTDTVTVTITY